MATKVKERPILFNAEMVRAVLDGRKTQTRRVITPPPVQHPTGNWYHPKAPATPGGHTLFHESLLSRRLAPHCPYGTPGERLWVRETWADVNSSDGPALMYRADGAVHTWHDFSKTFGPDHGAGPSMDYDAYPGDYTMWWSDLRDGAEGHGWKPSIHMPRWASRITLEVTDVRVERVQEITNDEARSEGSTFWWRGADGRREISPTQTEFAGENVPEDKRDYLRGFRSLWNSVAKPEHRWDANPWVWVVTLKRVEPEA